MDLSCALVGHRIFRHAVPLFLLLSITVGCTLNGQITKSPSATLSEPEKVTIFGLHLGVVPTGVSTTPTLTVDDVSSSKESDDVSLEVRVVDIHGVEVVGWQVFASGDDLSGLSLAKDQIYYFEARGTTLSGQHSEVVRSGGWVPDSDNCKEERLTAEPFANSPSGVDGLTEPTAFEICTPWQLNTIGADTDHLAKYFKIKASLDMRLLTEAYRIIGDDPNYFIGTIDGEDRTISNLTINEPTLDNVGLVGYARWPGGTLNNIKLENVNVIGNNAVGALVGFADGVSIHGSQSSGQVHGDSYVGGLIGNFSGSQYLSDSSSSASVSGALAVGGFAGDISLGGTVGTPVARCFATGTVTGEASSSAIGGFAGMIGISNIVDSFATGKVVGGTRCGGFVGSGMGTTSQRIYATGDVDCSGNESGGLFGRWFGAGTMRIFDAYATGNVSGAERVGGLVGSFEPSSGTSERLYASGNVTGTSEVGGLIGRKADSSSIARAFSVGEVTGASASGYVSRLIGRIVSGSANNSYYRMGSTCTNSLGTCAVSGTGIDTVNVSPNYFFISTNAPLSSWNFTTIWQTNPGALPTLRP